MQQTENYKLNLIETTDTFSPAPLNENMEKLETALDGMQGTLSAEAAALAIRVAALEARQIVYGTYTGIGSVQTVELGFTPRVVYVKSRFANGLDAVSVEEFNSDSLAIVEGGFQLKPTSYGAGMTPDYGLSASGYRYIFIAMA